MTVLVLGLFVFVSSLKAVKPSPTPTAAPTPTPSPAPTPTPTPAPTPTPTPGTPTPTPGTPTPTPGPTATPATFKYLTVAYTWTPAAAGSYLGTVTEFLGTKVWGQVTQPALSANPPLYFGNNKPAYNSAAIDVLVGQAQNDGKWTGASVDVKCYADWNPQYASGTSPKVTVTSYDGSGAILAGPTAATITPKTCYPNAGCKSPCACIGVPSTAVATITYNTDGTFTIQ